MPLTPDDMMSAVSQSLAARTGRSLEEWLAIVQASGLDPLDQNAVRGWLRRGYGVPQNSQWAIADVQEIDDEVLDLLRMAYEQNA
jgi:hypothetical protein